MDELNINKLIKGKSRNIKIGELSEEVINALNLDLKPQIINVWSTRIPEHCEKHKKEYSSSNAYNQAIKSIPLILKGSGNLLFRTIFPISEVKLKNSIKSGEFIPFHK